MLRYSRRMKRYGGAGNAAPLPSGVVSCLTTSVACMLCNISRRCCMTQQLVFLLRMNTPTPLERQLLGEQPAASSSALDAFRLAREKFLAGERIDMSALAVELGVNRGTLYRWVG